MVLQTVPRHEYAIILRAKYSDAHNCMNHFSRSGPQAPLKQPDFVERLQRIFGTYREGRGELYF
jgi:hypothetical protein